MDKHVFLATLDYLLTLHSRNLSQFSDIHSAVIVYALLTASKRNYFIGEHNGQRFIVFKQNRAAKLIWENSYAWRGKGAYLNDQYEPQELA